MSFAEQLLASIKEDLPQEACSRLNKLTKASPLYHQFIQKHPHFWIWIEQPENLEENFRYSAFDATWRGFKNDLPWLQALRRFRRWMSFRIAYREVNHLANIETSLNELTILAEYCIQVVCEKTYLTYTEKYGAPTSSKTPAYCILALGKLGGQELNFCSDIDLLYCYEGSGMCLKGKRETMLSASDFYKRLFQSITSALHEKTDEGFLFNVDLRLRPDGGSGPIAYTFSRLEQYYWQLGQTWERMALIKARPVAGNLSLGQELIEALNPFRYPRTIQSNFLEEISLIKAKIDEEELSSITHYNIKKGKGGIREIEFIVQAMQLMHAGKNPFLQTTSTLEAIHLLQKYKVLTEEECALLIQAYKKYRCIENLLQLKNEQQTHSLPKVKEDLERLLKSAETNISHFGRLREGIRALYETFFPTSNLPSASVMWASFLSGKPPNKEIMDNLNEWFNPNQNDIDRFRACIYPQETRTLSPEFLRLLIGVIDQFKALRPSLASPLETLERIGIFSKKYGSRKEFYRACQLNPSLLKSLCLLFDRSEYAYRFLLKHPELFEELLYESQRNLKDPKEILDEINRLPTGEKFQSYLWLYVKTEQIRILLSQILYKHSLVQVELGFSNLADATINKALEYIDPTQELSIIACGKWGSQRLTLGSDLDIILFTRTNSQESLKKVQSFLQFMASAAKGSTIYNIDTRLRPFGTDGPLAIQLSSFQSYHEYNAKLWERQLLTQARVVYAKTAFIEEWNTLVHQIVKKHPISTSELRSIWEMRLRLQKEKTKGKDPFCNIKYGPGGLQDIDFFIQGVLLRLPSHYPWESTSIGSALLYFCKQGILNEKDAGRLTEHYNYLKRIEHLMRSYNGLDNNELDKVDTHLAKWLGYSDTFSFWQDYKKRAKGTRNALEECLGRQIR